MEIIGQLEVAFFYYTLYFKYIYIIMDVELNAPEQFISCNNEKCSTVFKYLDLSVHTIVDGPDPRDHLANERNLLTWIRTGTTLSLVGMVTLPVIYIYIIQYIDI
jgi:hypothetical protein